MSDELWVMSDEWWVMEIEWWKMVGQTGSKLLTIYGVSLFGQSDFVIGHETLYVNHLKWE